MKQSGLALAKSQCLYEVTHYIRNVFHRNKEHPYYCAHGGDENKKRCIEAGMDAVLTKPLTQEHARDILKSFIPKRHKTPAVDLSIARKDLPDSDEELFQLGQFALLDSDDACIE